MKRVFDTLRWVGQGFQGLWRVSQFDLRPTEKSLLFSYWYDFVHFKRLKPGGTALDFLDDRVIFMKRHLAEADSSAKKKQFYGDLLKALSYPHFRNLFIAFLESSSPGELYEPLREALRRSWRMDVVGVDPPGKRVKELGASGELVGELREARPLHAKTYFIAAELYYELAGRGEEFPALSRRMAELMTFVKEQFGVEKLPGTFDKLKGYTYKSILTGRNDAKKGQLKPHFRQIVKNPEVFGEGIAAQAGKILAKHFD
jgi:hypothetical protein